MRIERERQAREDDRLDELHAAWTRIRDEADAVCRLIESRSGKTRKQIERRIRDRAVRRVLVDRHGKNWVEQVGRAEWESRGRPTSDA
jgi:hypothetical protein